MNIEPVNQKNLYGHYEEFDELVSLFENDNLPNKLIFSGPKGIGKCTLAYHLINYVLSRGEEFNYNKSDYSINNKNKSYRLTLNKSNPNFNLIDLEDKKKNIDINQIRNLIENLNKSSFNLKPRFVLIDNIEYLNKNSINALLKVLEEPNENIHFILIHNNKKIFSTLKSRCLDFKIKLSNNKSKDIINKLTNNNLDNLINLDFLNYYFTPGNLFYLIKFSNDNGIDIKNQNLDSFLKFIIEKNFYKKDLFINQILFELIEFSIIKKSNQNRNNFLELYDSYIKQMRNIKKFNLDDEIFFIELKELMFNG